MQAIAANNAPDVTLSETELLEIGAMHESDSQLAQSREIYLALTSLKRTLSKYGYRMTALHLDVISNSSTHPSTSQIFNEPFDFVLNKVVETQDKNDCQPDFSPKSEPIVNDSVVEAAINSNEFENANVADVADMYCGKRRRGSSNCSSESSGNGSSHGEDVEPYGDGISLQYKGMGSVDGLDVGEGVGDDSTGRKRARTSMKGESCSGQRFGCTVCGKMMSDNDTMVRHFRHSHQELKPFSCPKCRGFYSSEGTLWHHIRNVHTETPRKYKCSFCDASYDSFGAKTRHEHATHSSESARFVCSYKDCGRVFNFPAHLEAHALQMHPGFRPFSCDECPKSFPSANGLTRHAREVHLRPQAYSCSCNRSYSKRCHLKRHLLRVHGMSMERVQEEMNKQPHPGLLHMVPRAPPASAD